MENVGIKPAFWKGKRVLITGHTGFKGAWLSLWLQDLGALPVGYALDPPTKPNLFEAAGVARGMVSIKGMCAISKQFVMRSISISLK